MVLKKKSSKQYEEEEELEKVLSVNNEFDEQSEEELSSLNADIDSVTQINDNDEYDYEEVINPSYMFDEEKEDLNIENKADEEEEEENNKMTLSEIKQEEARENFKSQGINLPEPKGLRDPKKDKDPIEGEDLGLVEGDFLISRKVSKEDLELHNKINNQMLLGSNEKNPNKFLSLFSRGMSSKEQPKLDTAYNIENNASEQKEIAATQLLKNYHSSNNKEKSNMLNILKELKIEDEMITEIDEDKKAYDNQNFIEIIKSKF